MAALSTAPQNQQAAMSALGGGQGGAATPGQPAFGSSPGMTMPTANRGIQSAALVQVQWAVKLLDRAAGILGVSSEVGQDIADAIKKLSKHIPATPASSGVMQSGMQQFMSEQRQQAPQADLMRALAARQAAQPGGGAAQTPPAAD